MWRKAWEKEWWSWVKQAWMAWRSPKWECNHSDELRRHLSQKLQPQVISRTTPIGLRATTLSLLVKKTYVGFHRATLHRRNVFITLSVLDFFTNTWSNKVVPHWRLAFLYLVDNFFTELLIFSEQLCHFPLHYFSHVFRVRTPNLALNLYIHILLSNKHTRWLKYGFE